MNKYSELTDEAINVKIKDLRFGSGNWHKENCLLRINHCGSWNDTGPLIEKYNLMVRPRYKGWRVYRYAGAPPRAGDGDTVNDNLLRAICECILMIND